MTSPFFCYNELHKRGLNMKKTMMGILAGLLIISGCSTNEESIQQTPVIEKITGTQEAITQEYVAYFAKGDLDAIEQAFTYDEAMQKAINSGQLKKSLSMTQKMLGEWQESQTPFTYDQQGYRIHSTPMIFANDQVNINVIFNDADEIAGVNIGLYDTHESLIELHGIEKELSFTARDGKELTGTLTLPDEKQNYPVVVLVHGSGPNDRDETITPQNKVFRDLAWLLADQGIATYRYDKRTYLYGEEIMNDLDFTVYDETVNDAIDAVSWIKEQDHIDANSVYVLGHSQGGMMMPAIAQAFHANGYIMMGAPVTNLLDLLPKQIDYLVHLDGIVSQEENEQIEAMNRDLALLKELDALPNDQFIQGGYKAYWESMIQYDPIATASNIHAPVLVLQGEEDYQVPVSEYEMWKNAYGMKQNWEFHSYPGLSHLMQAGSLKEGPATYTITSVVDQRVIDDIVMFINSHQISH